jgi:hypothetical protein
MAEGYQVSAALRAMVVLDLADHLAAGPRTIVELARATGTHMPSLARLLRALVALDLCAYDDAGRVHLTPLGDTLRADAPDSLQAYARMSTSPWFWRTLQELPQAIRTGEPTFPHVYGVGFWDYLAAHPEEGAIVASALTADSPSRAAALLATCDFSGVGAVVDVGGGQGQLLASLVRAVPSLRGILADRPEVVAGAPEILRAAGAIDRCEVVAVDFFVSAPAGGDAYVLSQIICDWPDEEALAILRVCHQAMAQGARLWLLEVVVAPEDQITPDHALFDLTELTLLGGKARTAAEHQALLEMAGFTEVAVRPTEIAWSVIEAIRS